MDIKEIKNKIEGEKEIIGKPERIDVEKIERGKDLERAQEQPEAAETKKEVLGSLEGKGSSEIRGMGAAVSDEWNQKMREREKQVEKVLEEGMGDIYAQLPPEKQKEFKIMGERTAHEINLLLEKAKMKVNKIIELIRKWLMMIPGINKFFLEQEVKIKTDKIMRLKG